MTHDDGTTGYGRLFTWEKCSQNTANQLVLKCSTFLVPSARLEGGADGMEVRARTVVDDSACPNDPTTIVCWAAVAPTRAISTACRSR
jgi:hypothetical protein